MWTIKVSAHHLYSSGIFIHLSKEVLDVVAMPVELIAVDFITFLY